MGGDPNRSPHNFDPVHHFFDGQVTQPSWQFLTTYYKPYGVGELRRTRYSLPTIYAETLANAGMRKHEKEFWKFSRRRLKTLYALHNQFLQDSGELTTLSISHADNF